MHKSFIKYFIDPNTQESLSLEIFEKEGDIIKEGILKNKDSVYPIKGGIPRFVTSSDNMPIHLDFNGENGPEFSLNPIILENPWKDILVKCSTPLRPIVLII